MGAGNVAMIMVSTTVAMILLSALIVLEERHSRAISMLADAERRMLHSQKMAAIGQLARKVAHSVMNALTVVNGNAELAKREAVDSPEVCKLMDDTINAVEQASQFSGELLAFSNPGPVNVRCMDLGKLVSGLRQILQGTLAADVEVVIEADRDAGSANIDPDRIEQALLHLAVNGAEAMSRYGRLTIKATCAKLTEKERQRLRAGTHPKDCHDGNFALITVSDTGCGMAPETVSRIFEPFFSTKKSGANAGLGLATVYTIIQLHNGHIDVKTRPGHGTTFFIYLPACDKPS